MTGEESALRLRGVRRGGDPIARNAEKLQGVDLDTARNDAVSDFGTGKTLQ